MAASAWADLPPTCLDSVFELLNDRGDAVARTACKDWSRATKTRFTLRSTSARDLASLHRAASQGQLTRLSVIIAEAGYCRPFHYAVLVPNVTDALRRSPNMRYLDVDLTEWLYGHSADKALSEFLAEAPQLTHLAFRGAPHSDCLAMALRALPELEELEVCLTGSSDLVEYTMASLRSQLSRGPRPLRPLPRLRALSLVVTFNNLGEKEFREYLEQEMEDDPDYDGTSSPADITPLMDYGDDKVPWVVPLLLSRFPRLARLTLSCDSESPLLWYLRHHPDMRGIRIVGEYDFEHLP
eukprot:jgi/Tetstr1/463956/TSEL_008761.t1